MFKKFMFSFMLSFLFTLMFGVACVFASENGAIGDKIYSALSNAIKDPELTSTIWNSIIGLLTAGLMILIRVILKKIPSFMQGTASKIFWSIAKGLFGDGVVLSNCKDQDYLIKELSKKHPELIIVKKEDTKEKVIKSSELLSTATEALKNTPVTE